MAALARAVAQRGKDRVCPPELKSETRTEPFAETFIGLGRPFPSVHPLASWISEACQEPFFGDRWNDERDHSFPAFAAAG